MDGAGDAIVELDVELGELVVLDDAGVVEIAQRALVDDVAYREAFDGFVLRGLAAAAVAYDLVRVVAPVAIAPVVATLDGHFGCCWEREWMGLGEGVLDRWIVFCLDLVWLWMIDAERRNFWGM